jgi:hypothetical protein
VPQAVTREDIGVIERRQHPLRPRPLEDCVDRVAVAVVLELVANAVAPRRLVDPHILAVAADVRRPERDLAEGATDVRPALLTPHQHRPQVLRAQGHRDRIVEVAVKPPGATDAAERRSAVTHSDGTEDDTVGWASIRE